MGIFDIFKKGNSSNMSNNGTINYSDVDSMQKAVELANQGKLEALYVMPLRFNGEESPKNRLFVPLGIVAKKDIIDDKIEIMLKNEEVSGYACYPEYKGKSFIPSKLKIVAKKDGQPVFTEVIDIW